MNKPYVYVEYPKCMYNSDGKTMVVDNREEEDAAAEMGWMTAEKYHDPKRTEVVPIKTEEETEEAKAVRELDEYKGEESDEHQDEE
jgi:hypothetical protein